MFKQRRKAADSVAEALFAAEKSIDAAITHTAALAGLMPVSREEANLSALIGQEAILNAIQTMQALGQARQGIVETHKSLSIAQRDMGLAAVSFGNAGGKPVVAHGLEVVEGSLAAA